MADPKQDVNRDPGAELNFDDDEIYSGRGNNARTGGTWEADGGDSGELGTPREILSDRNGPSDPGGGPGSGAKDKPA
ncbi:MAG: hypothetical protein HYX47_00325 [Burkholderiales bacterium]|nr:hypothetical protein [Burkholderiales bacterium]